MDYASSLPHGVLMKIFSSLTLPNPNSVHDLCASACVCPSWRDAAAEPCLWRYLCVQAPLNARLTGPRLRNLVARSRNTLTNLYLDGCPLVTEAAMTLVVQQQPRLVYVSVEGCDLVTRPGLAYALCDAENFQGVVAQLNDPRQSAGDAQRCCVALQTLLAKEYEEEEEEDFDEAAEVLNALLRCVALHATHAGVQAACCYALGQYLYFAKRTEVASYPHVFQAVLAALKAYPLDAVVQFSALDALHSVCCFGLEGTPGVPALLDTIQPVLAALRAFPTDLRVQHNGCLSLVNMCKLDASMAEAVAAAGAMGLFIKALYLDFTNESIRFAAVEGIGAIALSKAALPQATAGIDAVVHAMNDYESSELAAIACRTLGIYLRCPATRERAVQAGAEAAIREALAEHSDDDDEAVLYAANYALQDPQA